MRARPATKRTRTMSGQSPNQTRANIIIGTIVLAVIGLGILLFFSLREPASIRGVVIHPRPSSGHDNTLQIPFEELPPVGGTHHDIWQNCGIYNEPVLPQHVVHSMEHGAAWVTYQPDLPESEIAYLQDMVRGQTYLILSPYPNQRSPVVVTAWGVQLELDSAQDRRIGQFIDRYRLGPQTPERGGACTGGIGEPIG